MAIGRSDKTFVLADPTPGRRPHEDAERVRLAWEQDRCALQATGSQVIERLVGVAQRIAMSMEPKPHHWSDLQKIERILTRQVRNRNDASLSPEILVGKGRDVAHVDARANDTATLFHILERKRDEFAGRRVDDCSVKLGRRRISRGAGPSCAKIARERLGCGLPWSREREDTALLPSGDLKDNVSGGAKSIKSNRLAASREYERAPTNQSCAQEGCEIGRRSVLRKAVRVARVATACVAKPPSIE